MPSSCATPLNGAGIGLAQAPIEMVRLHAGAQRRPPAAGQIRLIDVAGGDVFERTLDSLQVLARIVLGDRPTRPAALPRPASARPVADLRRCAESARPHAGSATIQQRPLSCSWTTAAGMRIACSDRADRRLRQAQARLDLARELVTQVQQPAAGERHIAVPSSPTPALARVATNDPAPAENIAPTRRARHELRRQDARTECRSGRAASPAAALSNSAGYRCG